MPKYYCDYCCTYLTHDSPSVRKTHNGGKKHRDAVRMYYQQWMEEQAQRLVDATAAAFKAGRLGPMGAAAAAPVASVSSGFAPPYGVPPMAPPGYGAAPYMPAPYGAMPPPPPQYAAPPAWGAPVAPRPGAPY